jgi:hypothetical protein
VREQAEAAAAVLLGPDAPPDALDAFLLLHQEQSRGWVARALGLGERRRAVSEWYDRLARDGRYTPPPKTPKPAHNPAFGALGGQAKRTTLRAQAEALAADIRYRASEGADEFELYADRHALLVQLYRASRPKAVRS